ncbi:hypothetical protein N7541_010476 [Penicillium brevicompactum]|uniref:Uncharacterized protein n=1 Tax=Penicillium brevicompactum TaxID=5074 RepID=A0A9W9QNI9_PENBR|nr:hypothetical protein N7541_010476 [Penicillium brevicompactum]
MFSKKPSKGPRRPSNPTWDNPPTSSGSAHENYLKNLPALPNDSDTSLRLGSRHDLTMRHSDVSPVGSPDLGNDRRESQSSFCVSPIGDGDQAPHYPRGESRASMTPSPVYRENHAGNHPQPQGQSFQDHRRFISGKPTRWDDFSGDPTTNEFGRIDQVSPRNVPLHKPTPSHTSNLFKQLNPKKKIFAARNRISSSISISKTEDLPKEASTSSRSSSRGFPVEQHSTKRKGSGIPDTSPQIGNLAFVPTTVTTISSGGPKTSLRSRAVQEGAPTLPRGDTPEFQFDEEVASMMLPSDPAEEPMSRFSATTYATTEPNSLNPSPRESFQFDNRSTDDLSASSIMDRRRPIAPVGLPTSKKPVVNKLDVNKPVRKPTPSQVAEQVKQLAVQPPPAAAEEPKDAQGRIEAMETKRNELSQRRFNLETVIAELMKVFQPNSLVVFDSAAKAEVQRSVKSMESEIADIKKEEHDLGMKITRAWRRLDERENAGDGNNLWVKRVTS